MAKSLSHSLVLTFAVALVANAAKDVAEEGATGQMKKCLVEGHTGAAVGMSMTWGYENLNECSSVRSNSGEGWTYEYKFSEAFSLSFERKCDCKIHGKTIVSFKPLTLHQAKMCAGNEEVTDPMELKRTCWDAYLRGRGTGFKIVGDMKVPEYKIPWLSGDFKVTREGTCDDEDCDSISVPGVLSGMSRDHKRIIGEGIYKIMNGQKDEVAQVLQDMIAILPESALDEAEFEQIDTDGDKSLTVDELAAFYPQFEPAVIKKLVNEIDTNDDGAVQIDEFSAVKEKMRTYDPAVDLIDGEVEFKLSKDGEVVEVPPEWKVEAVVCKKGGKTVDPKECEDRQLKADAIREFNTNCA